jgi:methionyl-tRNA synthetase
LGHAYTTLLADCLKRFHQLKSEKTFFLTGTDEHGDKIVQAAEENGETPKIYVDRISAEFQELWPELGIDNDYFIRTTHSSHKDCVQKFIQRSYDQGDIYFGEYGGYYCFGCERFYTEKELVGGLCPDHLKPPEYIHEANYFFRLSKYQEWLKDVIERDPSFIQPKQYRNEILSLLREPLDDLCISRPKTRLQWGIELPFDSNFVTYVWFDALINYISALGWPDSEEFALFWPHAYHLVAKDILKPHAIFWPIMLKSAGIPLYQGLRVHGYWKVDETKMSKSLGNVVAPLALRQQYGLDTFRYFLMREMHLGQDGNFSEQALIGRLNADLANDLGNLFNRSLAMTAKYFHQEMPEKQEILDEDSAILELGLQALNDYDQYMEAFQVAQALEAVWEFVRGLNQYIDRMAPWSLFKANNQDRLGTVLSIVLSGLRRVALCLWPIMPSSAQQMYEQLGLSFEHLEIDFGQEKEKWFFLPAGGKIAKKSNLFPRHEESKEKHSSQLQERTQTNNTEQQKKIPIQEIDFKDFERVDLRIGQIDEAEPVAQTDSLLRLHVDLGEEKPRQIVAGLASSYTPEQLVGRHVLVVTNLKPRKIRGLMSYGMVLAVQKGDGLCLLEPSETVTPGTRAK